MTVTKQQAIANINSVKSTTATEKKAAIAAIEKAYAAPTPSASTAPKVVASPKVTTPTVVKTSSAPATTVLLKNGSVGNGTAAVQAALGITVDDKYGPQTEAAVRAFQQANGLTVDGIVGPQTQAALASKASAVATTKTDPTVSTVNKDPAAPVTKDTTVVDPGLPPVEVVPPATDQTATAPIDTAATTLPVVAPDQQSAAITGSSYSGPSITDYLSSVGQPTDFASRAQLAAANGIPNYIGTSAQNTQLLNTLRQSNPGGAPTNSAALAGVDAAAGNAADPNNPNTTANAAPSEFQQNIDAVLKAFGITPPSEAQSPQSSFSETYQQVYESLGLQDIKDQYKEFTNQYGTLMDEKSSKIESINNDPWLTEGVRQMRLKKLDSDYQLRESNILDKIKITETMYDNGRQDAQFVTGGIMDQYNKSQALNIDIITKAVDIAESRAEAESNLLKDQQTTVNNLIETYPDAGINTTDTLEVAAQKAGKSAYFEKKIYTKPTSGTTKSKFTSTQLNKGAANMGTAIEHFTGFSDDTKNLFINNSAFVKTFKEDLANFNSGDLSRDDWIQEIEKAGGPDNIKQELTAYINSLPDNGAGSSNGFWDNGIVQSLVKVGNRVLHPPK